MQAYKKRLESQGYHVQYIEFESNLFQSLQQKRIEEIWFSNPTDRLLESRLKREAKKWEIKINRLPTPAFLTPEDWLFQRYPTLFHDPFLHRPEKEIEDLGKRRQAHRGKVELRSRE
jgi:deoxyribodipyrimidine photolyase-like uncharacterized protein